MRKLLCLAVVLAFGACSKAPDTGPASAAKTVAAPPPETVAANAQPAGAAGDAKAGSGIAWEKGDVDAAFAKARAQNKPVFLYWGAVWCPPCNQVKATLFNRQDFIERSRFFVPVYLDGDSRSAQKQGARFRVGGYPTMILFTPDGTEITRLPGEVEAAEYMRVLAMGMNGARPVKATLAAALAAGPGATGAKLTPEDWRMLAWYSWDTDEQQLVPKKDVAPTLRRLAQACPPGESATATRLRLKAMAAAAGATAAKPRDDKAARDVAMKVLADPVAARQAFDLVAGSAGDIAGHVTLPKSGERAALVAAWDAALQRFVADESLSATDRLWALGARVELARLDAPKGALSEPLIAGVREQAARGVAETTDPYARETVVNAAGHVLADAGLLDESDAMLKAELSRSPTPYYFMLGLAANAKKRGDRAGAVDWSEKAYAAASGPATRLQWGVGYVNAMIELTPNDAARIERAATQVIGELEATPDTFYDRNRRALERMASKLVEWDRKSAQHDSLKRIRAQLSGVCAQLPAGDPARAACDGVWDSRAVPAA